MIIIQRNSYMGRPDGRAVAYELSEEPEQPEGVFQWAYASLKHAREAGWLVRDDLEVMEPEELGK
jgi:hypothetical protein